MKNLRKINRFSCALLLSSFAAIVPFSSKALAQFKVTPLVVETIAKRGQASGMITVTNTGSEPARFRIQSFPFTYAKEGFKVLEESANDLTPFLNYSPRELAIQPGETRRIRFVSRLLPSTEPGEYRAVITSEKLNSKANTNGSQASATARLGVIVFVRHGEANSNIGIQEAAYNPANKKLELLAVNNGNASARPRLVWNLKQGETTINSGTIDETTVIAEGERLITIDYPEATSGKYQLTGELQWGNYSDPEKTPFAVDVVIP